jgi:ribosomal protein S18 acetylase RimI-like enzyme
MHTYDESFEDHWGHQPLTQEEWRIFYTHNPDFRPDLTTIAYDTMRNEVAGICIIKSSQDEIDRTGIKICYLPTIGTRRGWRKMGIGTTMLCDAMRKARAAGFDYVRLGVDSDNPSGALRLYQRFGFYVLWRWLWLEKDLAL